MAPVDFAVGLDAAGWIDARRHPWKGLMGVRPSGCPCRRHRSDVRVCNWWKLGDFGDRACLRYLAGSEVLGFVSLFITAVLDFGSAFLGCIKRSVCCGCNASIFFGDIFGVH